MALPKIDKFVLDAMQKFAEARTLGEQQEAVVTIADVIDELVTGCKVAFTTIDACIRLGMLDRQVDKETREILHNAIARVDGK